MKDKNIVYYSIINKENKCNESETMQAISLLKNMLEYLGIEFKEIYKDPNGKPYFKKKERWFVSLLKKTNLKKS